ncbi:uncharacterized protein LOC112967713 [Apteryx rowi]|uniref:uncharacterized protein LOC112967713 n=1 Tax=Apteryx rowi TaxID=308060 RepID=UPI000E1DC235|nr:uncharacterized protein LOC112967713 [Apteryx rowi]
MPEALCMGPDPRERTSEGDGRRPAGSQWQQAVWGSKSEISCLKTPCADQAERPKEVEKEAGHSEDFRISSSIGVIPLLSQCPSTSEETSQKKSLSENFLEWSPKKCFSRKKLFDACEMDLQHRMNKVFELLEIPALNDTTINSKQGLTQQMRDILKYAYSQNNLKFYSDVVSDCDQRNYIQTCFMMECCKVYCLLRLQDSLIKAEWCLEEHSEKYLEHVDKKGLEHCRKKVALPWPLLKSGEQVIRKGVIYDKK